MLKKQMHTSIEKMLELFYKQHEMITVMAVAKELQTKYKQLWAAIKQSDKLECGPHHEDEY